MFEGEENVLFYLNVYMIEIYFSIYVVCCSDKHLISISALIIAYIVSQATGKDKANELEKNWLNVINI